MPKAYWIGHATITDPEAWTRYQAANAVAFARFGGRFLVRGGARHIAEGQTRPRVVILEFPDLAAARACYDSPEYRAAMAHRQGAGLLDLVIVEGVD